jgi:diguanylate cyclase (GGDEF)-like protein
MRETLYDRFRPFKPYDLALAAGMILLLALDEHGGPMHMAFLGGGSLVLLLTLDFVQRLIHVPTPKWQAWTIVAINTSVFSALVHVPGGRNLDLAFYMMNVSFATVAFGEHLGIGAAVLSVAAQAEVDQLTGMPARFPMEWALYLAVLLTLVALLTRINRLQQDALFDAVSGLRNHRYFQVRLREEIQRADRYSVPVALALLDLDDFKKVNDRFGHAIGDQVLWQVARILERSARATDAVCRYGGEEIAVILPATSATAALEVAERFRRAIEECPDYNGPRVTASIGVAACPEHASYSDTLIAAADAALYRAKNAGKNRVLGAEIMADVETMQGEG